MRKDCARLPVSSCSVAICNEMDVDREETHRSKSDADIQTKAKGVAFLTGVTGISVIFGFGLTLAMVKKKDPNMFTKGLIGGHGVPESGAGLALKALAWGTLYSVSGVSVLCYNVWKMMGVNNMREFTAKVRSVMPTVPKKPNPGKTDFKTVEELIDFIVQDGKGKGS